jgi:CRISPR type III-A-associated RAMP protein Csm5
MTTTINLKITTLSPVTIGSGAEWSPYADYVIDRDQFYLLDRNKIIKKIAGNDQWMEQYVNGVASGMDNNRSEFDLKTFLIGTLRESIDNMSVFHCPVLSDKVSRKLPVKALLRTPLYEPFIPGSTLKGAFKTALLHDRLDDEAKDKDIESLLEFCELPDRRMRDKEITRWLERQEQELEDPKIIQQVTDSRPIAKENSIVVECWRNNMPLRFDCISEGTTSQFELMLDDYTWEKLAGALNTFSYNALVREWNLLKNNDKSEDYKKELDGISDLIDNSPEDVAYLRIGFGKGYFANSIGDSLFTYIKNLEDEGEKRRLETIFQNYLRSIFRKGSQIIPDFDMYKFPRTHLQTARSQKPLGWIKIEKV